MSLLVVVMSLSLTAQLWAKGRGWRTDESEKYLRWWDRTYQGTDSAVIGGILYQKGDYQQAIPELERTVKSGSEDGRVYYQLAVCYQQTGALDKAAEFYEKAAAMLDKQDSEHRYNYYARYNLALIDKDQGKTDKAISVLSVALEKHPQEVGALNLLGWLYWKQGDAAAALKQYQQSVKLDHNQEDAQYNLGVLLYNQRKVDKARKAFSKVSEMNPNNQRAQFFLKHLGDDTALSQTEYTELAMPNPAMRYCYLGKKNLDEKKYQEAQENYEKAVEINPKSVEAQQGLGVAYEYNDKGERYGKGFYIQKSIFHYQKALNLDPKKERTIYNLAIIYTKEGRIGDAIRMYQRLLRQDPSNAQAVYNLAVLYDNETDNVQRTVYYYNRYLRLVPDTPKKSEIHARILSLNRKM